MGGNNLVNLSLMHPRLLTTMILIDPVIQRYPSPDGNYNPAKASTGRREIWPSRSAAATKLKSSKFYQAWDPRVLDCWIQYGLRELPTYHHPLPPAESLAPTALSADPTTAITPPPEKQVTLTTTKHQEVLTFLRPNFPTPSYPNPATEPNPVTHPDVDPSAAPNAPFYSPVGISTFHKLPHLRPSVFYVFGDEKAGAFLSSPVMAADKLANTGVGVGGSGGAAKGRVSSVSFKGVGHLIPMEVVDRTAEACANWISPEIERWRGIEDAERKEWEAVEAREKSRLSEEYVRMMRSDWVGSAVAAAKKEGAKL